MNVGSPELCRRALAALGAAVLLIAAPALNAASKPLLTMVGDTFCPYNCGVRDPLQGYLIDLINVALGKTYRLDYQIEPWTRAVRRVESGDYQLLLATSPTADRQLVYTDALGVDRSCFFVAANSQWHYKSLSDLANMRLGVIQDYKYDNDAQLDQLIQRYQKEKSRLLEPAYGADALAANFRKLQAGRADVVVENENVGRYTLRTMGLDKSIRQAGCVSHYQGTLHIGLPRTMKDADKLIKQINGTVAEMRANGRLATLLFGYGIQDWQQHLPTAP